jgi:Na+-transporting methylmalonyl-CoA/oxaloacetate decarboxylase gamma subunit/vacuolar-type H+-ATPase subunit H
MITFEEFLKNYFFKWTHSLITKTVKVMMDEQKNLAAWECLDQALFTSSHVKAKDMEKGSTDWDNVYPVSKEETDKMKNLVDEAVRKADDPSDSFFRERVSDLREIISYSYSKHRTWKWSLIFGSIIAACIFWYFGNQDKEDAQKYAKDVTLVENWKKADTTITYDKLDASSELSYQLYERRVQSANAYKLMKLHDLKRNAESYREGMKTAKHSADTAKLDKNIESYKKRMAECEEKMEKYQDEFDEVADMDFDEIQKMALKDTQGLVDDINDSASTKTGWMIYLIILIPLYIISGYPRGYVISAHRRQHGFMRTLQKIGFAVASFFFGSGLLMSLLPDSIVEYHYTSGRVETRNEGNPVNIVILGIKFGLMIAGVLIFCFVSVLIMTIETISGLKRNFNWAAMLNKGKKAPVAVAEAPINVRND